MRPCSYIPNFAWRCRCFHRPSPQGGRPSHPPAVRVPGVTVVLASGHLTVLRPARPGRRLFVEGWGGSHRPVPEGSGTNFFTSLKVQVAYGTKKVTSSAVYRRVTRWSLFATYPKWALVTHCGSSELGDSWSRSLKHHNNSDKMG